MHFWTEEEVEFIRGIYPNYPNKVVAKMVKEKFGTETSASNLTNVKIKYGIPNKTIPNPGNYQKGQVPWNKGKGMPEETKEKVKKTWFKKGQMPKNHQPIGTTRITSDGYKEIKVKEPDVWQLYNRYIYEKEHGVKLEAKDIIIFADGNRENFDIDNLVKVSRANLLHLNRNNLIFDDPDLTKAGVTVSKVVETAMELERKEK